MQRAGLLLCALLEGAAFVCPAPGQQLPPTLREGAGRFRWSAYVQLRYTAVDDAEDLFAVRRLKLMIGGNLTPRVEWFAQGLLKDGNASPTDGRVYLQEAWVRHRWRKEVQFVAGQFKPPFGRERFTPDFQLATMERSLVTDALTPCGAYVDSFGRDRGIQVDGEPHSRFRYALGLFDGRGANNRIRGIGPMIVGQALFPLLPDRRLAGRPAALQLGGAYAARWARDNPFRSCCPAMAPHLGRFQGADRRWQLEAAMDWGGASFRAEYIRADVRFGPRPDLDFEAAGYYVQASRRMTEKWQAVLKYEAFDPNLRIPNAKDLRQTTAGLNYYIRQDRLKVMAGYVHRTEQVSQAANDLFQVQFQYFLH